MKLLITLLLLSLTACATYRWVDTSDCKEEVGNLKKCREVK